MGMMKFSLTIALLLSASAGLLAQENHPELKLNSNEEMRRFEPAANEEYTLGSGDQISITVANRPEVSVQRMVGPDGRVSIPLVGEVPVAGMTRETAADRIRLALVPLYPLSLVTIGVDKYGSNKILLLGNVEHPGVQYFDGTPTLLEVITRGGATLGTGSGGGSGNQTYLRSAVPEVCAIYRGDRQVLWVNLRQMLNNGNAMADLRLRRDDVVYVPSNQERYVSVLGQVQHPGAVNLRDANSLLSVLADAGGLNDKAGNSPTIRIVSPATHRERIIDYKELATLKGTSEVELHSGDIVFVSESSLNKLGYTLQQLNPLTTALTFASVIAK